MKRFIVILFCSVISNIVFCQLAEIEKTRILRVIQENQDSIVYKLKTEDNGEILLLNQEYYEYRNNEIYLYVEEYKKDKSWVLWKYKQVLKKEKKNKRIYANKVDGFQFWFNKNGKVIFIEEYQSGELVEPTYEVKYYPNGNLKLIAEVKSDEFWNIVEYKYPNGEKYNFGDFQNGIGTIVWLNDNGEPCLECNHIPGKNTEGKFLCEED